MTDTEQEAAERAKFETWILRTTRLSVARAAHDEGPFYGSYYDGRVQLAWEAWKEAKGIK